MTMTLARLSHARLSNVVRKPSTLELDCRCKKSHEGAIQSASLTWHSSHALGKARNQSSLSSESKRKYNGKRISMPFVRTGR